MLSDEASITATTDPTSDVSSPTLHCGLNIAAPIYAVGTLRYTKAGLFALFVWLLWGDFCFTVMETVIPSILPLKLQSLQAPNTLIAILMTTMPSALTLLITPAVSFRSDRFRSRWGR